MLSFWFWDHLANINDIHILILSFIIIIIIWNNGRKPNSTWWVNHLTEVCYAWLLVEPCTCIHSEKSTKDILAAACILSFGNVTSSQEFFGTLKAAAHIPSFPEHRNQGLLLGASHIFTPHSSKAWRPAAQKLFQVNTINSPVGQKISNSIHCILGKWSKCYPVRPLEIRLAVGVKMWNHANAFEEPVKWTVLPCHNSYTAH